MLTYEFQVWCHFCVPGASLSGLSLVLSHTSHETSAALFLILSDECDTLATSSVWAVPCEGKSVSWGLTPAGTDKGQSSAGGLPQKLSPPAAHRTHDLVPSLHVNVSERPPPLK